MSKHESSITTNDDETVRAGDEVLVVYAAGDCDTGIVAAIIPPDASAINGGAYVRIGGELVFALAEDIALLSHD